MLTGGVDLAKMAASRPPRSAYSGMDVQLFDDAAAFLAEAASYLDSDPFSASVIAEYAGRVGAGLRSKGPDDRWLTVTEGGSVAGVAMHTPPYRLFVARMPDRAAAALADALADQGRPLPGVNGESAVGAAFAAAWEDRTGQAAAVDMQMRMYRLGELNATTGVTGESRPAGADDTGWSPAGRPPFRPKRNRRRPPTTGWRGPLAGSRRARCTCGRMGMPR